MILDCFFNELMFQPPNLYLFFLWGAEGRICVTPLHTHAALVIISPGFTWWSWFLIWKSSGLEIMKGISISGLGPASQTRFQDIRRWNWYERYFLGAVDFWRAVVMMNYASYKLTLRPSSFLFLLLLRQLRAAAPCNASTCRNLWMTGFALSPQLGHNGELLPGHAHPAAKPFDVRARQAWHSKPAPIAIDAASRSWRLPHMI
jgi:hypothetical protein